MIFHIATAEDWGRAQIDGVHRVSTRGATLDEVGYLHCAEREQVLSVAEAVYGDVTEPLVLLAIDEDRLAGEVRREVPPGGDQAHPHLYGPLDVGAVVVAKPLKRGPDGRYVLPEAFAG